jgi:predicted dithiol-disulfide oxidoreductase (DUF899 family)
MWVGDDPVDAYRQLLVSEGGPNRRLVMHAREAPGMSVFALEDGVVCYRYSAFARGLDGL